MTITSIKRTEITSSLEALLDGKVGSLDDGGIVQSQAGSRGKPVSELRAADKGRSLTLKQRAAKVCVNSTYVS